MSDTIDAVMIYTTVRGLYCSQESKSKGQDSFIPLNQRLAAFLGISVKYFVITEDQSSSKQFPSQINNVVEAMPIFLSVGSWYRSLNGGRKIDFAESSNFA